MKHYLSMLSVLLMIMVVVAACAGTGLAGSEVPLWTVSELKLRLNDPDLVILDVRRGNDWTSSDAKIKGAVYADPAAYDEWAADYPKNQLLILYCA